MGKHVDLADGLLPKKAKAVGASVSKTETLLEDGERIVMDMLLDLQTLKKKSSRKLELRSSSLPFCPIRSFLNEGQGISYTMEHYTGTGTAIHTVLQSWSSRGKYKDRLWGNWRCSHCDDPKKPPRYMHQHVPKTSCDCHPEADWLYDEVSLRYKDLTSHVDTIFMIAPGFYVIIDYKTTYMEKKLASTYFKANSPSSRNYIVQIRTYCTIVAKQYGLNIVGWFLASVDRSEPIKTSKDFWILSGEWNEKYAERWLEKLDNAVLDYRWLKLLNAAVAKGDKERSSMLLNLMLESRPCKSKADYKGWMEFGFFGKDVCEHLADCCRGTDAIKQKILQTLDELT